MIAPENNLLATGFKDEELAMLTELLNKEGFRHIIKSSPAEAVSMISSEKVDIVLFDVNIEENQALKTLSQIKIINPVLPVIMLGYERYNELTAKAIEFSACSYIIKRKDKFFAPKASQKFDILVVDDDRDVADMVVGFLKTARYNPSASYGGREAQEAIKSNRPDVVFLDIIMPGIDGIELLCQIKEISQDILVVIMSGLAEKTVCVESIKKGASGYIIKPFSIQQLRATVIVAVLVG